MQLLYMLHLQWTNILLDLSQDGPDKADKPPIRDCLCRDGNSSSSFAHVRALYKKLPNNLKREIFYMKIFILQDTEFRSSTEYGTTA